MTDGTGAENGAAQAAPGGDAVTFSAAQQDEINRMVGRAREDGRKAERDKAEADAAAAETARKQKAEADRGNFQQVIDALTAERDGLRQQLEAATAEVGGWRERQGKEIDARVAEIRKRNPALADLDPGGDDLMRRAEWVGKAEKVVGTLGDGRAGNGANPAPGSGMPSADETYRQMAAARGVPVR